MGGGGGAGAGAGAALNPKTPNRKQSTLSVVSLRLPSSSMHARVQCFCRCLGFGL